MLYLGTLSQKYEKNIVTYQSNILKFVKTRIFVQKEYFEFGIKKAFLELWTQELDAGLWTLVSGRWTLDAGLWTLHSGRWTPDPGRYT